MDVLITFCEVLAVYILILIFIIVGHRKHPPSVERVKGKTNYSESYIVSVWNNSRVKCYYEYCFYKGKDGKYRLKMEVIDVIDVIIRVLGGYLLCHFG